LPTTLPVDLAAIRDRLESDLIIPRPELGSVEARLTERDAATRAEVESALENLATSLGCTVENASAGSREQIQRALATLTDQIEQLARERFTEATLLEGQGAALDRLAEQAEELEGRLTGELAELRRALAGVSRSQATLLAELRESERLRVIGELLPVADGLAESRRAAERLIASLEASATSPAGLAAPRTSSLTTLVNRLLGGPPSEGPTSRDHSTELRPALEAWLEGLRLLESRLLGAFAREGVEPIPAVGELFDPRRHLAVAVERPGLSSDAIVGHNMVVREERRGYAAEERVLRPAEVVVAIPDHAADRLTECASPDGSSSSGEMP
jgi:molecular chaperone GrpE (heat shock protein)